MKKKLLSAVLALTMGATCAAGLAACGNKDSDPLARVIDGLRGMYMDKYTNANTPSDFEVAGQYPVDGVNYVINWTVDVTDGVVVSEMNATTKMVTIDVDERATADIIYNLTASVTVGKKSDSITFANLKVPAYKVHSHAEYLAAADGDSLDVIGVVTGFAKKGDGASYNCIYFEDNDGGYYAYNLSELPEGLAIGDKVEVVGIADTYYNTRQLKSGTATIVNNDNTVTPTDITDVVAAATSAKDEKLLNYLCQLVTIKGVTVHNNWSDATYFGFKLGNVDSYVRISSSDCPTGAANQTALKAAHAGNLGKSATVTGVAVQYNGSFYLVPVSGEAFSEFAERDLSDADKVAEELAAVSVDTKYSANGTFDLPVPTFSGVEFSWVSDNAAIVVSEDGKKITVKTGDAAVTVKLTLTVTCGEVTDTKVFEITVEPLKLDHAGTAADPFSISDVLKIFATLESGKNYQVDGKDAKVYIKGYITDVGELNGTYGLKNIYIADFASDSKEESAYLYNINWNDVVVKGDANPLGLGDLIVVSGCLKNFNGTYEVADGKFDGSTKEYAVITSWTTAAELLPEHEGTEADPFSVLDAQKVFATLKSGETYQVDGADKQVYIVGYIVDAGAINGNYGLKNVYIADEVTGSKADAVYLYNINWNDVVAKADANPLKVGDLIVVYGFLKNFNGTYEVADGKPDGNTKVYATITKWEQGNLTDTQKVGYVKNNLTIPEELTGDLALPTAALDGVTLAFVSDNEAVVVDTENKKLVVTRGSADVSVTLSVTITCGEAVETADIYVTVKAEVVSSANVTFNFSEASTKKGTKLDNDTALELFNSAKADSGLVSVAVTNIYDGNGSGGGDYEQKSGFLKTGTSSAAGQLKLTFDKNVSKIVVKCQGWPSGTNTISVNGSDAKTLSSSEVENLEFELATASEEVTIDLANRGFILEIVVYFAD